MTDAPRFEVGEEVLDREDDEPDTMIVLDPERGRAEEVYIDALDATVADVNPDHPRADRVVSCVPTTWLEHHAGQQWTDWDRTSFPAKLRAFVDEWRIPLRAYDYPESRLEPVDAHSGRSPEARSPEESTQTSMAEWLETADEEP